MAELMARTSLDLELDLQASRTRQRQLNEEIGTLRELRQRLEDAQLRGQTDFPHWVLRDERFRSLLKEAERQVGGPGPGHRRGPSLQVSSGSEGSAPGGQTVLSMTRVLLVRSWVAPSGCQAAGARVAPTHISRFCRSHTGAGGRDPGAPAGTPTLCFIVGRSGPCVRESWPQ